MGENKIGGIERCARDKQDLPIGAHGERGDAAGHAVDIIGDPHKKRVAIITEGYVTDVEETIGGINHDDIVRIPLVARMSGVVSHTDRKGGGLAEEHAL